MFILSVFIHPCPQDFFIPESNKGVRHTIAASENRDLTAEAGLDLLYQLGSSNTWNKNLQIRPRSSLCSCGGWSVLVERRTQAERRTGGTCTTMPVGASFLIGHRIYSRSWTVPANITMTANGGRSERKSFVSRESSRRGLRLSINSSCAHLRWFFLGYIWDT